MASLLVFLFGFWLGIFFTRWWQKYSKREIADKATKMAKLASTMILIRLLENRNA